MNEEEFAQLQRQILRERAARKEAERLLEEKSLALYRANQQLQRESDKNRLLLASIVEGAYGVDTEGNCTFVNPSCLQMLGYQSADELLGKHMHTLMHHSHPDGKPYPASECGVCLAYLDNRQTNVSDEVFWRKDGSSFQVEYWSSPILIDGAVAGAIATFIDITERKRVEAEVLQLNAELEQKVVARTAALERAKLEVERASRGKDEFLAAISHELKTPLNHILGFADLLKEGLVGELSAEQKEMAQDIFDAGSKQLAIVNSLVELARLQAGKTKLHLLPEAPAKLLEEIAARHAAKARAAGLAFSVDVAEDMGEMPLDREVVTRLLDQLLDNAFKFTPSGGKVSLTARRVPREEVAAPTGIGSGEYLELAVADNGPGIAPEILPRLFQPFVQGDGRLARSHGGTGIGLVLVRLLAELHGGDSDVESKPGAGTKFLVWLPCGVDVL